MAMAAVWKSSRGGDGRVEVEVEVVMGDEEVELLIRVTLKVRLEGEDELGR